MLSFELISKTVTVQDFEPSSMFLFGITTSSEIQYLASVCSTLSLSVTVAETFVSSVNETSPTPGMFIVTEEIPLTSQAGIRIFNLFFVPPNGVIFIEDLSDHVGSASL